MKLGILTQPLEENYGGILQAYALQQVLTQLGHQSVVINRVGNDAYNRAVHTRLKHFLGRVYRFPKHRNFRRLLRPQNYMEQSVRDKLFKHTYRFIEEYIVSSPRLVGERSFQHYMQTHSFDGYIVGSDQCWRPKYSPNIYTYFLDFCKRQDHLRRFAYAVSFGVDSWEFSDEQTNVCRELVQKFDAVSVREESALALCQQYLGYDNAVHVLDPTLLLDASYYVDKLHLNAFPKSEGNLMVYLLDASPEKEKIVRTVGDDKGLIPFSVMAPHNYYDPECFPLKSCVQPPVEKWLRGFMDARFVVTDSFHGSLFSILFNKPFIVIGNRERGMTRFLSLLHQFDLRERLIYHIEDLNRKHIDFDINWMEVNHKREVWRNCSLSFLERLPA